MEFFFMIAGEVQIVAVTEAPQQNGATTAVIIIY